MSGGSNSGSGGSGGNHPHRRRREYDGKPLDRTHSFTRWPANRKARIELAEIDLGFCAAIGRILVLDPLAAKIAAGVEIRPEDHRAPYAIHAIWDRAMDVLIDEGITPELPAWR